LGPNHLQITLRTEISGVITRDFWVSTTNMPIFKNDLEIAKQNGTLVELRYHRDWTKNPVLVLDDVINLPGLPPQQLEIPHPSEDAEVPPVPGG
jgi:hypothetical protein